MIAAYGVQARSRSANGLLRHLQLNASVPDEQTRERRAQKTDLPDVGKEGWHLDSAKVFLERQRAKHHQKVLAPDWKDRLLARVHAGITRDPIGPGGGASVEQCIKNAHARCSLASVHASGLGRATRVMLEKEKEKANEKEKERERRKRERVAREKDKGGRRKRQSRVKPK